MYSAMARINIGTRTWSFSLGSSSAALAMEQPPARAAVDATSRGNLPGDTWIRIPVPRGMVTGDVWPLVLVAYEEGHRADDLSKRRPDEPISRPGDA